MATDAEKGLALLKSVVADHEFGPDHDDHRWTQCRRCLAIESLDNESAIREIRAFIKAACGGLESSGAK